MVKTAKGNLLLLTYTDHQHDTTVAVLFCVASGNILGNTCRQ